MIDNDKIEVFILTHNRAQMLEQSLESIINQTVKVNITVIDNASSDNTPELMNNYEDKYQNIEYVRNETDMGSEYSYILAGKLATREYLMCFHDDDILHSKYIETIVEYLNKYPNLHVISTDCHTPEKITNSNWEEVSTKAVYCKNYVEFASFLYYEGIFAYPATIYKTEVYKNLNFSKKPYGKIDDKVRCVEICKGGSALILLDKHFLRYRIHAGQDSMTSSTGPYYNEIINFDKYFKNILCNKIFSLNNLLYNIRNIEWIIYLYNMGQNKSLTIKDFIKEGRKQGAFCLNSYILSIKHVRFFHRNLRKILKKYLNPKRKVITL